jgi:hypothetical protein
VRTDRGRTKKLILAFHFQFSDQAAWKCERCREAGLETKRRCGFLARAGNTPEGAVWARKRTVSTSCPKSFISAASMAWLEEYYAWKLMGGGDYQRLTARQLDAFGTLEREMAAERNNSNG